MQTSPIKTSVFLACLYVVCAFVALRRPFTGDYDPITFASEFSGLFLLDELYARWRGRPLPGYPALAVRSLIVHCATSVSKQIWHNSAYNEIIHSIRYFLLIFSLCSFAIDQALLLQLIAPNPIAN